MLIREIIKEKINDSLNSAIESNKLEKADYNVIKVDYPKEESFGDYASSFALELAGLLKISPMIIGNALKEYIEESEMIEKVVIAKPGFINIFLSLDFLFNILMEILNEGDSFGKAHKEQPEKINIEFVSANPTGPLNIVSARAAAAGDTIANLLEAAGDIVDREYYINDHGNQVNLFGQSVLARYRELKSVNSIFPEDGYQGEYVRDIAGYCMENFEEEIDKIPDENALAEFLAEKAIAYILSGQKRDLEKFNIIYKTWFSEKALHSGREVEKTLGILKEKKAVYEENGRYIFKSTEFGDDKDRVVQREDGRPTYLLADIAYHINKFERGYDRLIDIWGPDHHGYAARLKGAMKALGYDDNRLIILTAQQVNLISEGEILKMSKRLGKFSTMSDLIDETGADAARFFFIMRSLESHLDFDLALAKRETSENPVFYLQYAHARICSVFREAEKRGFEYLPEKASAESLNNTEAIALLKILSRFPEDLHDAARNHEPHRIANYLLKLAQRYHKFYTEHKILSDDASVRNSYMALCDGVRIILKNGLRILGVSAPEFM